MPTAVTPMWNGQAIFGQVVQIVRESVDRAEQKIAAPGINGVGSLDMGFRGEIFTVRGRLVGATLAALNSAELILQSFRDGNPYVFQDNMGNTWANCKLVRVRQVDRGEQDGWFGFTRRYEATIEHLTPT